MTILGDWQPQHDTHAILLASITVQFGQAVTDVPWSKILRSGRTAAHQAGLQTENQLTQIAIAFGPTPPSGPPPGSDGIEFLSVKNPNFYEEKFTLERNTLRYENWGYTRWQAFSDRARDLVGAVLDSYINSVPLLGIAVEYVDRFKGPVGRTDLDASVIIKRDSALVAPRAFQTQGAWHNHSGWFEWPDAFTKRLVNADINVADAPAPDLALQHRFIQIRTAMTDLFNQPGQSPLYDTEVGLEFLFSRCKTLHDELKEILGVILTPEASESISLTLGNNT